MQICYDVVRHNDGWAVVITPARSGAFATKTEAFNLAAEYARKLRFVGYSVQIRVNHLDSQKPDKALAS